MTLHVLSGRLAATTNVEALTTPTAIAPAAAMPVIASVPLAGTSTVERGDRDAATADSVQDLGRFRVGVGESDTSGVARDAASAWHPIPGGGR